ncbi:MAG: FIST C-terminal domain-containing protein [Alphaproteobacteria bacterium]|nr:FIST C-terminal domain-containing protein [Alphaproteobacteria bacterium]
MFQASAYEYSSLAPVDLAQTVERLRRDRPLGGIVALVAEADAESVAALQDICRRNAIPLAGGVFPALIRDGGFVRSGALLLAHDVMPPTLLIEDANANAASTAERLADFARGNETAYPLESDPPVLFMVFDSTLPDICRILRETGDRLDGDFTYAGANAGSETFRPVPCLFDEKRFVQGGALVQLLPPKGTLCAEHGFDTPLRVMTATRTDNNRILTINDQPAFQIYQDILKADYGVDMTADSFYGAAVHYPFGILDAKAQMTVRIPVAVDGDGVITCVGEVPEGAMLALLQTPRAKDASCVTRLAAHMAKAGASHHAAELLGFYCAGRLMQMGPEQAAQELADLTARTHAKALVGALSLGEISTDRNFQPAFHNAVILCGEMFGGSAANEGDR